MRRKQRKLGNCRHDPIEAPERLDFCIRQHTLARLDRPGRARLQQRMRVNQLCLGTPAVEVPEISVQVAAKGRAVGKRIEQPG